MTCEQVDNGIFKRLDHLHVPWQLYLIISSCTLHSIRMVKLTLRVGEES